MIPDHPTQGDIAQKQGLVRLKKSIRRRDHGGEGHAIFLFAQYLTEIKYPTGFVCHTSTVQKMRRWWFSIFSVANLFCRHFPICHQDSRIAHFLHKWSHYPNHKPIYSNIEFKDPFPFPSCSPPWEASGLMCGVLSRTGPLSCYWGML